MNKPTIYAFCSAVLVTSVCSYAQPVETRVNLHSTVTGNREQPRVMYIVPWEAPGDSSFEHTLQRSIARELFDPIDRDEFLRELKYQSQINAVKQGEDHGKL